MQLDTDTSTLRILEGLSDEALLAHVNASNYAPPLLLHTTIHRPKVGVLCCPCPSAASPKQHCVLGEATS